MKPIPRSLNRRRLGIAWRVSCTITSMTLLATVVTGIAALPSVALWKLVLTIAPTQWVGRVIVLSFAMAPAYGLFALCLMPVSAAANRLTGARTPDGASLRLADMDWAILRWGRYVVAIHIVRVFSGSLYRSSPIWTWYLRLNGARIGQRVYVNSLDISDHNLLEIGDDSVVGADVHLSAHTVEGGVLKTAGVTIGRGVTIGINTVVDIDVECGDRCQVAAMSFVPKHSRLESGALYGGIPVRRLDRGPHLAAVGTTAG